MNFTIEETVVPEVTATRKPNPFDGHLPTAEGKAITVTLPNGTEEERKEVEKTVGLAQRLGRESTPKFTTRVKRESFTEKQKQYVRLTMWSVKAVTRPRAGTAAVESGEAAAAAATDTK